MNGKGCLGMLVVIAVVVFILEHFGVITPSDPANITAFATVFIAVELLFIDSKLDDVKKILSDK